MLDDVTVVRFESVEINAGNGRTWTSARVPRDVDGCGDAAATIDFDHDGMDDVVVINGGGRRGRGPDQLLTMGDWSP